VAVTAGKDKAVRVWDLGAGQLTRTLTGHAGQVAAVACTILDGGPVAVNWDGTARVWSGPPPAPVCREPEPVD
jgi:WD40 repeat protein